MSYRNLISRNMEALRHSLGAQIVLNMHRASLWMLELLLHLWYLRIAQVTLITTWPHALHQIVWIMITSSCLVQPMEPLDWEPLKSSLCKWNLLQGLLACSCSLATRETLPSSFKRATCKYFQKTTYPKISRWRTYPLLHKMEWRPLNKRWKRTNSYFETLSSLKEITPQLSSPNN